MKLIIGLGNPGKEYVETRHNAGFLFLDFLQKDLGFESFALDKKMSAEISTGTIESEKVLLVKPATFMNDSGTAIQTLTKFYKVSPSDIVVIHDDLDIASNNYRPTVSSRAAGHNGVQDVIDKLGTQEFFRIRLGIDRPVAPEGSCISIHDYVLQKFTPEEHTALQELFPKVKEGLLSWITKQ